MNASVRFRSLTVVLTVGVVSAALGVRGAWAGEFRYVIEAEQLAEMLKGDTHPVVLDVREEKAYLEGHVEGAVRVDAKLWRAASSSPKAGFEAPGQWYQRIGELGIAPEDEVIIYDGGEMTEAARVWFILQYFGASQAKVVNGGYKALNVLVADRELALSQEATKPETKTFAPVSLPKPPSALIDRSGVRRGVEQKSAQVLDVRTEKEFSGEEKGKNPRGGHIPGAILLPHTRLLDEDGLLREPEELAKLFEEAGLVENKPIVTHCQSGGRSSLAALALIEAGHDSVSNYYLSFGDWAGDESCPVVTSAKDGD